MFTRTVTRELSGRSMTTSSSCVVPSRSDWAIGVSACGSARPSVINSRWEPQNNSSVSPTVGCLPHNSAARWLYRRITPLGASHT